MDLIKMITMREKSARRSNSPIYFESIKTVLVDPLDIFETDLTNPSNKAKIKRKRQLSA